MLMRLVLGPNSENHRLGIITFTLMVSKFWVLWSVTPDVLVKVIDNFHIPPGSLLGPSLFGLSAELDTTVMPSSWETVLIWLQGSCPTLLLISWPLVRECFRAPSLDLASWLSDTNHPNRCEEISHRGFELHFPGDECCGASFHLPGRLLWGNVSSDPLSTF